jgi:ribonuclease HII
MQLPTHDRITGSSPIICGVDEAGRGALAGPLVAAGVIVTPSLLQNFASKSRVLADGKKLNRDKRAEIIRMLDETEVPYTTCVISARIINSRGIQYVNRQAIRQVIRRTRADVYFVDGTIRLGRFPLLHAPVHMVIGADGFLLPVILAGILAKHTRDRLMDALSILHPAYAWNTNAGYGTRDHIRALSASGTSPEHRRQFVNTALARNLLRAEKAQPADCGVLS